MIKTKQVQQMLDAVHLSPRDSREVSAYLSQRAKKADKYREGRLKQANNNYQLGMADLANVRTLAERLEYRVVSGDLSPQEARAELDTLRRSYQAGWETVETAGASVAEITATDPVEAHEAFLESIPALAERVVPPLPVCLARAAHEQQAE
ncbi:hypothetical protein [Paractinoplanes durhamensis]|uniref:Uncharacterized protein n=1 Tax=Paractinoplanes durhamensis TaxID=113563 RepID=A0ABQ3ZCL9_9ACTN|nr:hypothetical protein [Actinoplanes durhamensis]GIE07289.1 hypothetical protein Adu01nite_86390 [Actinoplanes durhamensis]